MYLMRNGLLASLQQVDYPVDQIYPIHRMQKTQILAEQI